jgi:Tfp pilus assembly protein PilF
VTPSPADVSSILKLATRNPVMMTAALALYQDRLHDAEPLLKAHLHDHPFDFAAIRMLAELAARIGRPKDSEALLRRALEIAPGFGAARANLATLLYHNGRPSDALGELDALGLEDDAGNGNLRAAVLNRLGEFNEALALYEDALGRRPDQPHIWLCYGHVLKTVGRLDEGIAAYRRAVALSPQYGEAWWSLANLKKLRFSADDIAVMTAQLSRDTIGENDRFHLEFALGKAHEDAGDAARAFAYYDDANRHRRATIDYSAADARKRVDHMIDAFSAAFFKARVGQGCASTAPIFIVGMPRAGSTLIEQILASHRQIEGINELPDIPMLWTSLGKAPFKHLADMSAEALCAMGAQYCARIAPHRKTDRPYFIDKLPNNWLYIGFIKAILPNAKIIDARRHPLSCGFSNFKQHFARGQGFSYDLSDMGHYYGDYVRLLIHFDETLPGAVYRVVYERMVADSETEIRALLNALDLPFEADCLSFHENERAVRTPSSEQVRSPIFRSGVESWQAFEPWLGPLKDALGPALAEFPAVL